MVFNETDLFFWQVSKLVASEILRQSTVVGRAAAIEKWAAVADICRCMHNYNSVLEITSALMNSSVYRLKKVWDKVPKQVSRVQGLNLKVVKYNVMQYIWLLH